MTAPICRAPSVSLYFEVDGTVLACCHNRMHPLGRIQDQSIDEIWRGEAAQRLRGLLAEGDLSHGCRACASQIEAGNRAGSVAATFDPFEAADWPRRMEFALSNRCNFACIQCNGQLSSRIRRERDRLPPIPASYGDRFFAELRPFLPHLEQARFFGGEPFLADENFRIWAMMNELGVSTECNVTTNGSVLNDRVRGVLADLPFSIGISLDGVSKSTLERVRVGADYSGLMRNVRWFRSYAEERGTWFGLTFCLMRENWREFGAFLEFADSLDAPVAVNRVDQPVRHSLFALSSEDLGSIIGELDRQDAAMQSSLSQNRPVWDAELRSLRQAHEQKRSAGPDEATAVPVGALDAIHAQAPFEDAESACAIVALTIPGVVDAVLVEPGDRVSGLLYGDRGFTAENVRGRTSRQALGEIIERLGTDVAVVDDRHDVGVTSRVLDVSNGSGRRTVVILSTSVGDGDGTGGEMHVVLLCPQQSVSTPVPVHLA